MKATSTYFKAIMLDHILRMLPSIWLEEKDIQVVKGSIGS